MKSLSNFLNESLTHKQKHDKAYAKKTLKLIKQGKLKPKNKQISDKITNALKKKHILESQEVGEEFYDDYRDWVESTVSNWSEYWDDEDAKESDLDTAEDYFSNEFDTFCDEYGYDDPDYDSDKLSEIVQTICDYYND